MKASILTIFVLTLFVKAVYAQDRIVVKKDTVSYQGVKYYPEKVIRLGYGSGQDKNFVFVFRGSGITLNGYAVSSFAKADCKIIDFKVMYGNKCYIKAKWLGGIGNLTIDLEGAVDNKEITAQ